MNREIKFRAWHDGKKKWLHDSNSAGGGCNILGETILLGGWCVVSLEELNDVVVEQFTGLKDKNGKDIYEGDICYAFKANSYLKGNYIVAWHNEKGRWYYKNQPDYKDLYQVGSSGNLKCEVIGNIHENPDLIK